MRSSGHVRDLSAANALGAQCFVSSATVAVLPRHGAARVSAMRRAAGVGRRARPASAPRMARGNADGNGPDGRNMLDALDSSAETRGTHPAAIEAEDLDAPVEQKRRDVGRLLQLFARLAVPYLRLERKARVDAAAVVGMALAQNGVSVMLSYISRDFWSALNTKDLELFQHQTMLFFVVLVACVPVITYYGYIRDMAALRWRNWMTEKVLYQYTENRAFYDIDQEGTLDNPDQRLSSDLAAFTSDSLAFSLTILTSAIDIVSFSAILYSIYPQLFIVLITYAATGTAATIWFGKHFVALNRRQLVREADFRYALIRLRENAESIAFFNGQARERKDLMNRFALAVDNMTHLIGWQRNLGFLQNTYRYAVQVVPALVVAPKYFAGLIQLGTVTQSFSAFNHIFSDLSLVVSRFDSLSQLGAQLGRIQEICDAVEAKVSPDARIFSEKTAVEAEREVLEQSINGNLPAYENGYGNTTRIVLRELSDGALILDHVTLLTPSKNYPRVLVRDVNLKLPAGGRLLVAGPSGVGKSSLIRAIAGLWNIGSGVITRPLAKDIFFLPQRPYCTLGSLTDNLVYPKRADGSDYIPSEKRLQEYLDMVDLHDLPSRMGGFGATCDWGDTLSLGEQQRLSFARLLISKPKVVCIDEGSSALDMANEERLYDALREMRITVVSVGHRPSLLRYHDTLLRLGKDDGSWTIEGIGEEKRRRFVAQTL
jgi:vitamin B12/bleomycin/antimicrobial peptide transport system ATP-binding/permease protein